MPLLRRAPFEKMKQDGLVSSLKHMKHTEKKDTLTSVLMLQTSLSWVSVLGESI